MQVRRTGGIEKRLLMNLGAMDMAQTACFVGLYFLCHTIHDDLMTISLLFAFLTRLSYVIDDDFMRELKAIVLHNNRDHYCSSSDEFLNAWIVIMMMCKTIS